MSEGIVAREDASASTTLELQAPLELDWSQRDRWPSRAVWAEAALIGLIALLTGAILATEMTGRIKLVALTVVITLIWSLAHRRGVSLVQTRGLEPVACATLSTITGLVAVSLFDYWLLDARISPGKLLALGGSVFLLTLSFDTMASRGLAPRRRVLIVGADADAVELIADLNASKTRQFRCVGFVPAEPNAVDVPGVPRLGGADGLLEVLKRDRAELIVCSDPELRTRTVDQLLDAGVTSVRVVSAVEFYENFLHRVAGRHMQSSWFASVLDIERKRYPARSKRAFDVVLASAGIVLTLPLVLLIAILIKCSSRGPVLYRQARSGEGGELFEILKFRTMIPNAENGRPVWASKNDPRITSFGRVLRKTRLDELPQLWNVFRCQMSIVGPRPERPEYLELLRKEVPYWSRRHLLRPGITGWAQVNLAYTDDIPGAATKLSYDLYYLKHRSLGLDLLILLKTAKLVLLGTGAR